MLVLGKEGIVVIDAHDFSLVRDLTSLMEDQNLGEIGAKLYVHGDLVYVGRYEFIEVIDFTVGEYLFRIEGHEERCFFCQCFIQDRIFVICDQDDELLIYTTEGEWLKTVRLNDFVNDIREDGEFVYVNFIGNDIIKFDREGNKVSEISIQIGFLSLVLTFQKIGNELLICLIDPPTEDLLLIDSETGKVQACGFLPRMECCYSSQHTLLMMDVDRRIIYFVK